MQANTTNCNHLLQVRAEFLDITLAVLCFTAPEIEARLRQVVPGRGRAGAAQIAGAQQIFALADGQPESVRKVCTWLSADTHLHCSTACSRSDACMFCPLCGQ